MTDVSQDSSKTARGTASVPDEDNRTPEQQEVIDILYTMKQDPELQGISLLGKDGVLRSWDADRNVVDAVPLRPELIKAFFETLPPEQQTGAVSGGVDGRTVPEEEWSNPPKHLIPEPLPEEHRERDPEKLKALRKAYLEHRARFGERDGNEHEK